MIMDEVQTKAYQNALSGKNLFLTGPAGTGKSFLIHNIHRAMLANKKKVAITATTGAAAVLIKGSTLHSYLGIGLGQLPVDSLVNKILSKKDLASRLRNLDVLVIDEVSMMSAELFSKIIQVLKTIRKDVLPQLILCGDFAQLQSVDGGYCFTSKEWQELKIKTHELKKIYRQTDPVFQELLGRARYSKLTPDDIKLLESLKSTQFPENIQPTRLYTRNIDVDKINQEEYEKVREKVPETERKYAVKFDSDDQKLRKLADNVGLSDSIMLCKGAQVMITRNIDQESGLINGTRGVVIGFCEDNNPIIQLTDMRTVIINYVDFREEDDDKEDPLNPKPKPKKTNKSKTPGIMYMPLKLAWAITIHKSQGMTLDCVEMDIGPSVFAYGQAYTALSRARDLSKLRIINVSASAFKTHPYVLQFYRAN